MKMTTVKLSSTSTKCIFQPVIITTRAKDNNEDNLNLLTTTTIKTAQGELLEPRVSDKITIRQQQKQQQ